MITATVRIICNARYIYNAVRKVTKMVRSVLVCVFAGIFAAHAAAQGGPSNGTWLAAAGVTHRMEPNGRSFSPMLVHDDNDTVFLGCGIPGPMPPRFGGRRLRSLYA